MITTESIIEDCLRRWKVSKSDDKIEDFKKRLPQFVDEFSGESRDLIIRLIKEYDYFPHPRTNECLKVLHEKVKIVLCKSLEMSVFCVLKNLSGILNSSSEYLIEYRYLNNLPKESVIANIDDFKDWEYIENVVFVDDICGSGDSLITLLNQDKYKKMLLNKRILYVVVYSMAKARDRIKEFSEETGYDIDIIYYKTADKVFDMPEFTKENKELFKKESIRLGVTDAKNQIFGHAKSESLVSFYNNSPNNTMGLFREDTIHNTSLFPRIKMNKPSWSDAKTQKKQREVNNYSNRVLKTSG